MFLGILLIAIEIILRCPIVAPASSSNNANFAAISTSGSFSLRSQVEVYDNGILKASVRTLEQYSRPEQRAVVELEQDANEQVETGARVIYYYDGISMVWLRWARAKCLASRQTELDTEIYGKELPHNMSHWLSNSSTFGHVIGAAQLLVGTHEACKSKFVPSGSSPRMIRGIETVGYGCELDEGRVKLEVLYAPFSNSSKPDGMPIWLKMILTGSRTLVINFCHIKRLDSVAMPLSTPIVSSTTNDKVISSLNLPGESSFLFPLGVGCGRVLRETVKHNDFSANERDLMKSMQRSIHSVSFRAKYPSLGTIAGTGNSKNSQGQQEQQQQVENHFVSLNMRAKLLRREATISLDPTMGQHKGAKSITIYDFGPKRTKYNLVSTYSSKARDYNYSLSNIVDEGSQVTDCVAMLMQVDRTNEIDLEFVRFERLQFMGLAQVDGVEVRVYEDDHLERLPFWLDPRVSLDVANSVKQANGSTPSGADVAVIYYFAADHGYGNRKWLNKLLRLDIIVRDPLRNSVLIMAKEVRIFNFIWNQLVGSPSGVRDLDLFSLSHHCVSNGKSLRSAHLAMYLEQSVAGNMAEDNQPTEAITQMGQWSRNEAILRALSAHFHLPQTHLDHIGSSLVVIKSQNRKSNANIRLEFRANHFEGLKQVQCRQLGRGEFLSQDHLMQSDAFTFEDCLWFANYYSDRIKDEIVFAHDKDRSLCLVDRLYRWRELQHHEACLAMTNRLKSLNYFPYEYGKHVMHTIGHEISPNDDDGDDFLDNLKILNHIGRQLSLTLDHTNSTHPVELSYSILQMKVIDKHDTNNKQGEFKHLGWHYPRQSGDRNKFLKRVAVESLVLPSNPHENPIAASGAWTEALCQYHCLVDVECKSYSFCERSLAGKTECLLSKLDIRQPEVAKQLNSIQTAQNYGTLHSKRIRRVSLPSTVGSPTDNVEHVHVRIDRRCSIHAKLYGKLFDNGHQTEIDLAKQPEVFGVAGRDECAEKCFAKNLDYLKGILRHKLNLKQVHEELTNLIKTNQPMSESAFDEKLDSATNWHHGHLKNLCSHFMYADINNSTKNPCILSGLMDEKMAIPWASGGDKGTSVDERNHTVAINVHRMIFSHLYERMQGFRLSESPTIQQDNSSKLANYTRRLEFYRDVRNTQILLATGSVEHCARVCTLQTHGPRPACSSFDYVQEKGSRLADRKYCLLNSQSLHDLRRSRAGNVEEQLQQQVVHTEYLDGVQLWHFEPRDSLLEPLDSQNDDDDDLLVGSMIARLDRSITKQTIDNGEAFRGISLAIALFGIVSGLFLGLRLVQISESIYRRGNIDEIKFKNSVIRTIHRLSGVSLGLGVQGREVQM